jgi:hypothetical protein
MGFKEDKEVGLQLLHKILENFKEDAETPEDLFMVWMYLGDLLGIDLFVPYKRLIVSRDENDEKRVVGLIGCCNEEILEEMLEGEKGFDEEVISKCTEYLIEVWGTVH